MKVLDDDINIILLNFSFDLIYIRILISATIHSHSKYQVKNITNIMIDAYFRIYSNVRHAKLNGVAFTHALMHRN
jgi:hypothetical protein